MNDKVYWYRGWWKLKRLEGEVKGFTPALFSEGKAVVLVTKSESDLYKVGQYTVVEIDELRLRDEN